jgi:hypothetical protein
MKTILVFRAGLLLLAVLVASGCHHPPDLGAGNWH